VVRLHLQAHNQDVMDRAPASIQTCWPFIIGVALRRTRRPRPGLAIGASDAVKDGATARARARGRRQDR